jgi:hypothetical protein
MGFFDQPPLDRPLPEPVTELPPFEPWMMPPDNVLPGAAPSPSC